MRQYRHRARWRNCRARRAVVLFEGERAKGKRECAVTERDSSRKTLRDLSTLEQTAPRARARRRPRLFWLVGGCFAVLALLVVACGAIGGMAVGIFQFAFHEPMATAETLRTFAVQDTPQLIVTNPAGAVTLATGVDNSIRIEATRHARDRTEDDARKALATIALDLRQDGETVSVVAQFTARASAWPGALRGVDLLISVPVRTKVSVTEAAGDIRVGALTGQQNLHVDAGNIDVTGATISSDSQMRVGAGNVTLDGALASGAALDVRIDAGNATLTLPSSTTTHIEARTDAGDVAVRGWPISTRHTTGATLLASGDTRPDAQSRLTVAVEAGDVTIRAR